MSVLAGEWWEADPWWQFVLTLVIGVIVGGIGAWATIRSANPKHRINWWVEANTSLLNLREQPANGQALTVQLGGRDLQNPRVVELVLANVGKRDVTAAMFHGSGNMRLDFGAAAVVGIIRVGSEPAGFDASVLEIQPVTVAQPTGGSWLDMKPFHLKRGYTAMVTMLIDGDEDDITCTRDSLVNVEFLPVQPGQRTRAIAEAMRVTTVAFGPIRFEFGGGPTRARPPFPFV